MKGQSDKVSYVEDLLRLKKNVQFEKFSGLRVFALSYYSFFLSTKYIFLFPSKLKWEKNAAYLQDSKFYVLISIYKVVPLVKIKNRGGMSNM